MKRLAVAAMATGLSLPAALASDAATGGEAPPSVRVERGRQFAEQTCASCHAIGQQGESPRPEAPPFRRLSERYPPAMLQEAFAEGVVVGHPDMPEFALDPERLSDLVAYLESIQDSPRAPGD